MNINRSKFRFSLFVVSIICFLTMPTLSFAQKPVESTKSDYYVAAYIWPSCHNDPLAHKKLWSEGIGEWEVIKKGIRVSKGTTSPASRFGATKWTMIPEWLKIGFKYECSIKTDYSNVNQLFQPMTNKRNIYK